MGPLGFARPLVTPIGPDGPLLASYRMLWQCVGVDKFIFFMIGDFICIFQTDLGQTCRPSLLMRHFVMKRAL